MKAPSLETGLFFASIRNLRHTNPRTIEGCRKSTFTAFARLRYNGCMITLAVLDYRMPSRAASSPDILETPFGPVAGRRTAGTITLAAATLPDPRAAAYAARLAGAERVLAVILEPDLTQPTLPRDFIEFTDERPTTFFETVGTGYVQQQPPFCRERGRGATFSSSTTSPRQIRGRGGATRAWQPSPPTPNLKERCAAS